MASQGIILLYSTTDGQTLRIAQYLQSRFAELGRDCALTPLEAAESAQWQAFAHVIVGASIRYGKHQPQVLQFANRHAEALAAKHNAFFSVSAVARKAEKRTVANNAYVRKFLARSRWQPQQVGIFGGRITYSRYKPWDRFIIRLIMRITKGPTAADADVEFTDWAEVREFAEAFVQKMKE